MLSATVASLFDCAFMPEPPERITPYRLIDHPPFDLQVLEWRLLVRGWWLSTGSARRGALCAEASSRARPCPEAARNKASDDAADVAFLADDIGWPGVVARD